MQEKPNKEIDVRTIALETLAPVYAALQDHAEGSFLQDAFFAAHCPSLLNVLRNPDALRKAGLMEDGAMSPTTATIVRAYVDQDGNGGMLVRPIAEPYISAAP